MVDGSKNVFSRKEVPFGGHVITWSKLWAWLPKSPPFWALFGKTWFAVGIGLKLTYNRDQSSDVSQQWLKWCVFRPGMSSSGMKLHSSIRGCTGPQKPQNLGVKGTAKKSKKGQKSTFSNKNNTDIKRQHLTCRNRIRSEKQPKPLNFGAFAPQKSFLAPFLHANAANTYVTL